jgi:hypothetical protein
MHEKKKERKRMIKRKRVLPLSQILGVWEAEVRYYLKGPIDLRDSVNRSPEIKIEPPDIEPSRGSISTSEVQDLDF